MFHIPMRTAGPLDRQTILSPDKIHVQGPLTSQNINTLTAATPPVQEDTPLQPAPARPMPQLLRTVQKGQKTVLGAFGQIGPIKACLGWRTLNAACDVDVSAFLLDDTGKVPGDSWFVFYGQEKSPDNSTVFLIDQGADTESISIDLTKLDPSISKIVFVLTIDRAFEKHLDLGMIEDAYIRLIDPLSDREIVSFKIDGYCPNVISMMIGEIYRHKGSWRFNAIGNGVVKDLAGLCRSYGVQVI